MATRFCKLHPFDATCCYDAVNWRNIFRQNTAVQKTGDSKVGNTIGAPETRKQSNFSANLKTLCSYYRSISDVSRKLQINRSQFNKYLTGATRPSMHILRRLEMFFGVEEHELMMPPRQFAQLLELRPARKLSKSEQAHETHIRELQRMSGSGIQKYAGNYFEYYLSMSYPGHILRSLIQLHCTDTAAYYRRIERLAPKHRAERRFRCVYLGMAFYLADRLFLVDYESLTGSEISQSILFPNYKSRITFLSGLKLGVSADNRHMPTSTRVVCEYLGRDINLRHALRLCGLYDESSGDIEPEVKQRIKNSINASEHHLVPARFQ